MNDHRGLSALYIWSMKESKLRHVTSGLFNDRRPPGIPPAITCTSWRIHEFHPQLSQIEFDFATNRARGSS